MFTIASVFQCAVIVATVRALKMHGGGPDVVAGKPLDTVYKHEQLDLLRVSVVVNYLSLMCVFMIECLCIQQAGCANLIHHIHNIRKFGVCAVVAINRFSTDTENELELVSGVMLVCLC